MEKIDAYLSNIIHGSSGLIAQEVVVYHLITELFKNFEEILQDEKVSI